MNRRSMPLILMLVAGAITCIITFVQKYSILGKLVSLLVVLLVFYFLGSLLRWTLDYFDEQNEIRNKEEGEVIEKDAEEVEGEENKKGTNKIEANKAETNKKETSKTKVSKTETNKTETKK